MTIGYEIKKSVKFDVDLDFDYRRSKHELVQEMTFVNMCVKFRDNRIRNKKCYFHNKININILTCILN